MDAAEIRSIYFVNSDLQAVFIDITDICTGKRLIFHFQIFSPANPDRDLMMKVLVSLFAESPKAGHVAFIA